MTLAELQMLLLGAGLVLVGCARLAILLPGVIARRRARRLAAPALPSATVVTRRRP